MIDFKRVFTCILNVAGAEVQGAKELYSKEFYPHLGYLGKLPEEMIYKAETERMAGKVSEDGGFLGRAFEKTVWNLELKEMWHVLRLERDLERLL